MGACSFSLMQMICFPLCIFCEGSLQTHCFAHILILMHLDVLRLLRMQGARLNTNCFAPFCSRRGVS